MTAPAAFQGSYADLRFIKSRKVCQVVVELPIEQASAFVEAFGAPNPASEIPVAIARLQTGKAGEANTTTTNAVTPDTPPRQDPSSPAGAKRRWGELRPSQQAGIRCGEDAFWRFLSEHYGGVSGDAAAVVRNICSVDTRADLDRAAGPRRRWLALDNEYQIWLREPEHV